MNTELKPRLGVRLRRGIRQIHRWLALLIALQVLLWVGGGVIMSILELDEVRGDHLVAPAVPATLDSSTDLYPIERVVDGTRDATAVTLVRWLGRPVYQVVSPEGTDLVDARTGERISPIDAAAARAVAVSDYAGPGSIRSTEWVTQKGSEYRGHTLPLWRVRFDDRHDSTLYISPQTGRVVARRNDLWRIFDFVWMLHIMDYEEREDFNHPLLVSTAVTALLFVLTGLAMLVYSFLPMRQAAISK